jgi:hypothetical protein
MNCGVSTHAEECLCDVQVKEITPINHGLPDYLLGGRYLAQRLNIGTPWTSFSFATFMGAYMKGWDVFIKREENDVEESMHKLKKLTLSQMLEVKEMLRNNVKPSHIRRHVLENYGVTLHRSYPAQVRGRMIKRGEM